LAAGAAVTMPSATAVTPTATKGRLGAVRSGASALARSGFALVLGSLIASALGMVFWAIAARLLPPDQLGIGVALISTIVTLSHASQLNLRNLLHRFAPTAGSAAASLIHRAYLTAALVALVLGAGFAVLAGKFVPELTFIGQSPLAIAGFVAALVIWTLYSLQEAALTSLRLAAYVPLQSLVYSLVKIAVLTALAGTVALGATVVAAWVVPALAIGLVAHMLAFRRRSAWPQSTARGELFGWQQVASFMGWDYLGVLATSMALGVAPLMVASLSGATEVAPYYLAWSVTYVLYLVSRHMGAAMLAERATHPNRRHALYAETILLTVIPVVCGALVILMLAPQIMLIFGSPYIVAGTDTLRILAVATVPGSLVTAYLAICRAEGWVRAIAGLQIAILVALVAIGGPLTASLGSSGMAWAWLAANSLAAMAVLVTSVLQHGHLGLLNFGIDLTSAGLQLVRQVRAFLPTRSQAPTPVERIDLAGQTWLVSGTPSASLSDVVTLRLTAVDDPQRAAILKRASTPLGQKTLEEEHVALLKLRADATVRSAIGDLLAEPLDSADGLLLLSALPGVDMRRLIGRPTDYAPALAEMVKRVSALHRSTGRLMTPDPAWMQRWIDAPFARIEKAFGSRRDAGRLAAELRGAWSGSDVRLGIGHGDFCPDNLLVEVNGATAGYRPSGLVDWGGLRLDAPSGIDACTMALTLRSASSGCQLGQVVLDLLRRPEWTSAELAWLACGGDEPWLSEPAALRKMVLLAWLQHVDANIGKSVRYAAGSFWGLANVKLVLQGLADEAR
jgi:O-antigen/teichoic acid export membrane protein